MIRAAVLLPLGLLSACTRGADGPVEVAIIGESDSLSQSGTRLSPPSALVAAATAQGLVRFDEAGQVVPGIAERWIVTGDGTSYIFRIRETDLPGGDRLTARVVQKELTAAIGRLSGTSLGLDLAQVRDVRAMTGRVVEVRLVSPLPGFLQILAQPELGLRFGKQTLGPMKRGNGGGVVELAALTPQTRGYPAQPGWSETVRPVRITAMDAASANRAFANGDFQLLLGGTLADLPLADVGPLSRGTVRLDSVVGQFGLDVARPQGFLAQAANREAVALALDRAELVKPFNIAGWRPTTRIVAPGLADDPKLVSERWVGLSLEQRRAIAAARVARWKAAKGGELSLTVSLPKGPGSDVLMRGLSDQLRGVGIALVRAGEGARADLVLRDRPARYAGPRWFLTQFDCRIAPNQCVPEADALVMDASVSQLPQQQERLLADAEGLLTAANLYIPIGAPIRWSLVRSGVRGFSENAWGVHPLFPLSRAPI